jgi:hypothetical protein
MRGANRREDASIRYGMEGNPRVSNPLGVDRWCCPVVLNVCAIVVGSHPLDQVGDWLG